jgi:hypothetical protein
VAVDPARHFAADYASARRAFLAAAEARRARVTCHPLRGRGPAGEELALDAAWLGPEGAGTVLAVSSGIHGVEGFAGSAIQHQLLVEQLDGLELPRGTALLLVHAVNPHGFAWLRRVNESNVDLNRNFLRHPEEHRDNPGYEELYDAINPGSLDEESEAWSRRRLAAWSREHGFQRLQEAVTCGQYRQPEGVQFGGVREEESNRGLREIVRRELRGARRVAWVDLHTGLGPWGACELITEAPPDHPAYLRGRAWYGEAARSTVAGESVSAALHGVMERGIEGELPPGCELTAFAPEFGTYEPTRVFWAMRADNWLHRHGDPASAAGRAIQQELLEVFRPADPAWQRLVLEGGARALRQTRDGLAGLSRPAYVVRPSR